MFEKTEGQRRGELLDLDKKLMVIQKITSKIRHYWEK